MSPVDPETRKEVFARDKNRCIRCNGKGELELHHVIPRDWGGSDLPRNLVVMCRNCHDAAEAETERKQHGLSLGELTAQVTEPREKVKYRWYRDERGFLIKEEI